MSPSTAAQGALCTLDAMALAQGYREGAFTPVDVTLACLARIEQVQPRINAMVSVSADAALEQARASTRRFASGEGLGMLDGIPMTVKDNLHVSGMPTTWGSQLYGHQAELADELPVQRLRAAGAVLLGKTNLPEFAMQGYTANARAGTTRNPWDERYTPGGSSGGAAAAVASGCGPLALATDGGGSIRRPAAHCGLFGFKPSEGLVPRAGGLPEIFLDYETVGALGRSTRAVRALMAVLAGQSLSAVLPGAARIRYLPVFGGVAVDPAIAANTLALARSLAQQGHEVTTAETFHLVDAVNHLWPSLSAAGLAWLARAHDQASAHGEGFEQACGEAARASLLQGRALASETLYVLQREVMLLRRAMSRLFDEVDFLLTPATAALPWAAEAPYPVTIAGQRAGPRDHAVFTALANAAGLPAITIPTGCIDGLPTGVQLIGARGSDARVLAMAEQIESALPGLGLAMPARPITPGE